jgi:uncharacterized protein YegJ (DUF2314 family)
MHDINIKPNSMVKITIQDYDFSESFWVWIEEINDDKIIGIISNNLVTKLLEIGQKITFDKSYIKEISNRSYTKEETLNTIEFCKNINNPITKYFESINTKFNGYKQ